MESYKTEYTQDEIMTISIDYLEGKRYKIETEGYIIRAVGKRDYNQWVVGILAILCIGIIGWIGLPLYWFTRKKNAITIDATSKGKFTISYAGKKAFDDTMELTSELTSKRQPIQLPQCPNCNAQIPRGVNFCPHCGQELEWY